VKLVKMIHGDRSSYTTDTCNDLSRLKDYATAVIRIKPIAVNPHEYSTLAMGVLKMG
jgi:hypothetical protein